MRKGNVMVSVAIVVLFFVHGIAGGFQMMGLMPGGTPLIEILSWIMVLLLTAHVLLGTILTVQTIQISRRAGAHYFKENILFWVRRISGFTLMILLLLHFHLFVQTGEGIFRLKDFDIPQLVGQLLMVLALAIHLLCNIRPIAVALGFYNGRGYVRDVVLIFSIVLLFCALAFVVYDLRWNVWWR